MTTHDHQTAARDRQQVLEAEHWKAAAAAADELDEIDRLVYGEEFIERPEKQDREEDDDNEEHYHDWRRNAL